MRIAEVTQQFTHEDLQAAHTAYNGEPTRANLERVWAIQNVLYPRDPEPTQPQQAPMDYRGEHEAPMAGDGCPMWEATANEIYPADFYTHGFQYYSNGPEDNIVVSMMYRLHGRPNAMLSVYRAVPKATPRGTKVNRGDWVTPVRRYALEHGRANLNGQFRIIKLLVRARDIFTDGNSLQEWGYDPQPRVGPSVSELARQRASNVTESRLVESYSVMTRDDRGNWLHGDELLADPDTDKVIFKWPSRRYGFGDEPMLVVFPVHDDLDPGDNSFFLYLFNDHTFYSKETYEGELQSVARYVVSRFPQYAEFTDHAEIDSTTTLASLSQSQRKRQEGERFWYHGTSSELLPQIQRFGLMPQSVEQRNYRHMGGSEENAVYLTVDPDTARMHAENAAKMFGGPPVVLKIDMSGLHDRLINDKDFHSLPLGREDSKDRGQKRAMQQGSYLTIQTAAYRGRIPANRIQVEWQGKTSARVPARQRYEGGFTFVNQLGSLVPQLSPDQLTQIFAMVGARTGGWNAGRVYYPKEFYAEPAKMLNGMFSRRRQPARYARWLRGMMRRSRSVPAEIRNLVAQEFQRVNPVTESTQPQAMRTFYHVTPHTRIKTILAQGLNFGHKPQWSNVFGAKLGERRKIYLFSDMDAAIQMAARMEWGLKSEKRKSTQVDIIELQTNVPVEEDPHSGAYGELGKWWMTAEPIPPSAFVRVIPLTLQMTRDFIARRDGRG